MRTTLARLLVGRNGPCVLAQQHVAPSGAGCGARTQAWRLPPSTLGPCEGTLQVLGGLRRESKLLQHWLAAGADAAHAPRARAGPARPPMPAAECARGRARGIAAAVHGWRESRVAHDAPATHPPAPAECVTPCRRAMARTPGPPGTRPVPRPRARTSPGPAAQSDLARARVGRRSVGRGIRVRF